MTEPGVYPELFSAVFFYHREKEEKEVVAEKLKFSSLQNLLFLCTRLKFAWANYLFIICFASMLSVA